MLRMTSMVTATVMVTARMVPPMTFSQSSQVSMDVFNEQHSESTHT